MKPWIKIAEAVAPDGIRLELRRRDEEHVITAGGRDLMSSEDGASGKALAELGCRHLPKSEAARVLVGGLGMGFTLRAALDAVSPDSTVEVVELVPEVVSWNREHLSALAGRPLDDPRVELIVDDVAARIGSADARYDVILLDVDNGPSALAHQGNDRLYARSGIAAAQRALRPGGVLGVWSFSDDERFSRRLVDRGFEVATHRVSASRKGRGRYHLVWIARRNSSVSLRQG